MPCLSSNGSRYHAGPYFYSCFFQNEIKPIKAKFECGEKKKNHEATLCNDLNSRNRGFSEGINYSHIMLIKQPTELNTKNWAKIKSKGLAHTQSDHKCLQNKQKSPTSLFHFWHQQQLAKLIVIFLKRPLLKWFLDGYCSLLFITELHSLSLL